MDYSETEFLNRFFALSAGILVVALLITIAILVFLIVALVKLYKKAGREGWEAIVPYYNSWALCEIAGVKWWFFIILQAPSIAVFLGLGFFLPVCYLATIAGFFAINYNLAIRFKKDPIGYGIGLTLLPIVFFPILAFGDAKYEKITVSSFGPIPEEKTNENATAKDNAPKDNKTKSGKFCKNCGAEISDGKFCPNCGSEIH